MSVAAPAPTVTIHPLAISAICDHYTRVRAGGSTIPTNAPVMGLLFGTKPQGEKSSASIFDATDVFYEVDAQNQAPIIRAEEVTIQMPKYCNSPFSVPVLNKWDVSVSG